METKSEQHLKCGIDSKIKEFELKDEEEHFKGVKAKLKSLGENGVFSYLKK